jgi:hypothetical protein
VGGLHKKEHECSLNGDFSLGSTVVESLSWTGGLIWKAPAKTKQEKRMPILTSARTTFIPLLVVGGAR